MVTQVNARPSAWLDGIQVAAQDLRLQQVAAMLTSVGATGATGIAATAGVRNAVGSPLAAVWQSGMGFNLNAGMCFVQGTASAIAGLWNLTLDTTTLLTVGASDPTNPRIDSVIAVVVDAGNNTSTAVFKILPGTAAGSPVAPTLPANALRLWNIAVAANAVVLSQANFTDVRVWTGSSGGITPVTNAALGTSITGPDGSYVEDLNTGRLRRLTSGVARQPKVAGFAAVSQQSGNNIATSTGSYTVLASVSVTTDGSTEIEIYGSWLALSTSGNSPGDFLNWALTVDGVNVLPSVGITFNGNLGTGGNWRAWATPAAGTHTVALQVLSSGHAYGVNYPDIRVAPSLGQ